MKQRSSSSLLITLAVFQLQRESRARLARAASHTDRGCPSSSSKFAPSSPHAVHAHSRSAARLEASSRQPFDERGGYLDDDALNRRRRNGAAPSQCKRPKFSVSRGLIVSPLPAAHLAADRSIGDSAHVFAAMDQKRRAAAWSCFLGSASRYPARTDPTRALFESVSFLLVSIAFSCSPSRPAQIAAFATNAGASLKEARRRTRLAARS